MINVLTTTRSEEAIKENDYNDCIEITFDDKDVFRVHDGEPEDNNLSRNFSNCYNVSSLMEQCYKNGVNGIEMEFQYQEEEE